MNHPLSILSDFYHNVLSDLGVDSLRHLHRPCRYGLYSARLFPRLVREDRHRKECGQKESGRHAGEHAEAPEEQKAAPLHSDVIVRRHGAGLYQCRFHKSKPILKNILPGNTLLMAVISSIP